MDNKSKILVLVEGDKTDFRLMKHLLDVYGISDTHEIVSYHTNIYTLYKQIFNYYDDVDSIDTLQILKEHEKNPEIKKVFDRRYSDILLIFDLDPQDSDFSPEKILKLAALFNESSDKGKLYINFPMVEAFYHMKSIPDKDYNLYRVKTDKSELKKYKARVTSENRNHDYSKFAVNKSECDIVIRQNIDKAFLITEDVDNKENLIYPELTDILNHQFELMSNEQILSVLCTCAFYIPDYNPDLLK